MPRQYCRWRPGCHLLTMLNTSRTITRRSASMTARVVCSEALRFTRRLDLVRGLVQGVNGGNHGLIPEPTGSARSRRVPRSPAGRFGAPLRLANILLQCDHQRVSRCPDERALLIRYCLTSHDRCQRVDPHEEDPPGPRCVSGLDPDAARLPRGDENCRV